MTKRGLLATVATVGGLAVWWFYVADWISKPQSYRLPVVYISCVVITAVLHVNALTRFIRMVRTVRLEEKLGAVEPGATLFALNQRFRYLIRVTESMVVLVVGVVLAISISHPKVAMHHWYARLIITYFVGSIVATGVLTLRDLQVINWSRRQAEKYEDAATVQPTKRHVPPR